MDVQRGEVLGERQMPELALEAAVLRDVAHRHQAERLGAILKARGSFLSSLNNIHCLQSLLHMISASFQYVLTPSPVACIWN